MWRRMIPLGLLALGLSLMATAQEKQGEQEKPESPKRLAARAQLGQIGIACMMYRILNDEDPQSLAELVKRPDRVKSWPEGGFLPGWQEVPLDPWGNEYVYKPGGGAANLTTLGADGRPGGEGEDADLTFLEAVETPVTQMERNQRYAAVCLKILTTAEAAFRSNDHDGNRVNDFWTGDVYSLYALVPVPAGATAPPEKPDADGMIKLIEPNIANADAAPLKSGVAFGKAPPEKPETKFGYLIRACKSEELRAGDSSTLKNDTDGEMFYGAVHDRNRFAFCAYPAEYGKTGRLTFIVNEDNTLWCKDTGGKPIEVFPFQPGRDGWKKLD